MGAQDISIFEQNNSQLKNQSTQKQETTTPEPAVDFNAIKNAQMTDFSFYTAKSNQADKKVKVTYKEYKAGAATAKTTENDVVNKPAPTPVLEEIYYYHSDHLGTGTFLSDSAGNPYQFFLNLPFGETMIEQHSYSGDYTNRYKFNGKELDEETGYYYYGARYYNPRFSIWLSVDVLKERHPEENPYIYCGQNPIVFIDPDGNDRIYSDTGNFLYDDGKKTNLIKVRFGNEKDGFRYRNLSQLDYSNRGTRRAVSKIIASEAKVKGYKGWFGVKVMKEKSTGAHTMPNKTRTVFFNTHQLQQGTYDNFYNMRSTIYHEADTEKGHRGEDPNKPETYLNHAKVYLNQTMENDFYNTTESYRDGKVVGFIARLLKARQEGEIETSPVSNLINYFNNHHNGKYFIDYNVNSGIEDNVNIYNQVTNQIISRDEIFKNIPSKPEN